MRTKEQYVENPNECPSCGSTNIVAGDQDYGHATIFINVDCHDCGASWTDEYTLIGYDNFNENSTDALELEEE